MPVINPTTGAGGGGAATDTIYDAKGDLAAGTGPDAAARLPVGTNGQFLTAQSGQTTGLQWATGPTGAVATDTIWDTKGDIAAATGADAASKLAAGSNGQFLTAQSGQTTGLQWASLTNGGIAEVTSLPGSPAAGDMISFLVDDTNGIEWLFRRNAANTKWRFQGGAALFLQVDTAETTASTTPVALTTALSLSVPFTAVYEIEWGADMSAGASAALVTWVSIDGATPTTLPHGCRWTTTSSGTLIAGARKIRASVATSVAHQYSSSSGTGTFSRRWLSIRPVSVAS